MNVPTSVEIGIGGTFALLIIKIVFDFVSTYQKKRNDKKNDKSCVSGELCEARRNSINVSLEQNYKLLQQEIKMTREQLKEDIDELKLLVKNGGKR